MAPKSVESENVAAVKRLIKDGLDELNPEVIEETAAEQVEVLEKDATVPREVVMKEMQELKEAMPDLKHEIHDIWETDETVIVHYSNYGTFENKLNIDGLMGMEVEAEPNGEEIEYSGVYITKVENGQITAWANYSEDLSALQQLGAVSL